MGDNNSGSKRYTEKYMIPLELAEGTTEPYRNKKP
jgi:hypothetical protein